MFVCRVQRKGFCAGCVPREWEQFGFRAGSVFRSIPQKRCGPGLLQSYQVPARVRPDIHPHTLELESSSTLSFPVGVEFVPR